MKHTKGNWKITDDRFIAVDDKELICEVYDRAGFLPRKGTIIPDEETANANAKLIAAAPDLLEALIEVVRISDRKHDAWDKAKAAIQKATAARSMIELWNADEYRFSNHLHR